jgi:hypothetical protein
MAMPLTISEIWAWVSVEADGSEGIPASSRLLRGQMVPLLGADEARIRSLQTEAEAIADFTNTGLKLMRFGPGVIVEVTRRR